MFQVGPVILIVYYFLKGLLGWQLWIDQEKIRLYDMVCGGRSTCDLINPCKSDLALENLFLTL